MVLTLYDFISHQVSALMYLYADISDKHRSLFMDTIVDIVNVNFYEKSERDENSQKIKFFIKDFFSKYDRNPQFSVDLVTFAKEIFNGKLYFFCNDKYLRRM